MPSRLLDAFIATFVMPGKQYQYICGRTDIQAAHMMGFHQPEGKCVLFINDPWQLDTTTQPMDRFWGQLTAKKSMFLIVSIGLGDGCAWLDVLYCRQFKTAAQKLSIPHGGTKDVYGINSLGESLRFLLSGFGGRQVLVMVWHPSVLKALSHHGMFVI